MSDSGPFEERTTIVRPNPGGRLTGQPPTTAADAAPPPRLEGAPAVGDATLEAGASLNPLVAAAAPILALVSRLSTMIAYDDLSGLRRRLGTEFAAFDKRAEAAGVRPEIRRASHYALCATVDDVAANTPWGGQNAWASQSMARMFHNDASGGERFFHLLTHFERDPETHADVLELFYFCLSLGFQGRLALLPEGAAEIATIRGRLHRLIRRRRGEIAAELSPHWRGLTMPHRRLSARVPHWVVAACTAAILLVVFMGFRFIVGSGSDSLFGELAALPKMVTPKLQASPPRPPPPPPAPPKGPSVREFLAPEIREGLVTVDETPQNVRVRLRGSGLFQPGSATLEAGFLGVIDRIGAALKDEPGQAMVVGHTDNQPIKTLQFPSNYELSLARAKTVRDRLARELGSAERISFAGLADAEPIADNATRQGRELNRRIDIVVLRSKPSR